MSEENVEKRIASWIDDATPLKIRIKNRNKNAKTFMIFVVFL